MPAIAGPLMRVDPGSMDRLSFDGRSGGRECVATRADTLLQGQIENALDRHPHFHGRRAWVRPSVANGVVRLEGCLPSWYLLQLLVSAVGKVPGVKCVEADVQVRDWSQPCGPDPAAN